MKQTFAIGIGGQRRSGRVYGRRGDIIAKIFSGRGLHRTA